MAVQRQVPFVIDDKRHVLSAYGARTDKTSGIAEMRVSMNGWNAQMLLHDLGDLSDLTVDDLKDYAASRGMSVESIPVHSLLRCLQRSRPVHVGYNFMTKRWDISLQYKPIDFTFDYKSLAVRLHSDKMDEGVTRFYNAKGFPFLVYDWQPTGEMKWGDYDVDWKGDSAIRRDSPLEWFKNLLGEYGLPLDRYAFHGFIESMGGSTSWTAPGVRNNLSLVQFFPQDGLTCIVGPSDLGGRCPMFVGPRIDDHIVIYVDATVGHWRVTGTGRDFREGAGASIGIRSKGVTTSVDMKALEATGEVHSTYKVGAPNTVVNLWLSGNQAQAWLDSSQATTGTLPDKTVKTLAYYASGPGLQEVKQYYVTNRFPFPEPTQQLPFLAGTLEFVKDRNDPNGIELQWMRRSKTWRLASGNGFVDVLFPDALFTFELAGQYPVDRVMVNPGRVHFTSTIEPIRAHLSAIIADKKTTAADRAQCQKALADSAGYSNSLTFTTVYGTPVSPVSQSDVERLTIVRDGREAGMDMMNEDLGQGMTLKKAGNRLEGDKKKGRLYYAFQYQIDEATEAEDILSPGIVATRDWSSWKLRYATVDGNTSFYGHHKDGADIPISVIEYAFLLGNGASAMDGSDEVLAAAGYDSAARADLVRMTGYVLSGGSWTYEGASARPPYALKPSEFLSSYGFPVARFTDTDSQVRSLVTFKGFGEDGSDMLLSLFFCSAIDIEE